MRRLNTFLFVCSILTFIYTPDRAIAQTSWWVNPNNPVLNNGQAGEWDSGIAILANVVLNNDTVYLFYTGGTNFFTDPLAIGLATSTDGLNFTKYNSNPIFEADGNGFDAWTVARPVVINVDTDWLLYYDGRPSTIGFGPDSAIGLATSTSPYGPWVRSEDAVLEVGTSGEWDDGFLDVCSVVESDSGFFIFYTGGDSTFPNGTSWQIGMAFSEDGLVWNKYDDPTTTSHPYAESDPVLQPSPGSWDYPFLYSGSVLKTGSQWEMIYDGGPGFGYAVSSEGIHWTKDSSNPVFTPAQDPYAGGVIEVPSVLLYGNDTLFYYMYYDYSLSGGIGVAIDTSDYIVDVESISYSLNDYELFQNYPNPFNPVTTISYNIPEESIVNLSIHNILGEQVGIIVNQRQNGGKYEVTWNASDNPSGIYIYTLEAVSLFGNDQNRISRKMILLK